MAAFCGDDEQQQVVFMVDVDVTASPPCKDTRTTTFAAAAAPAKELPPRSPMLALLSRKLSKRMKPIPTLDDDDIRTTIPGSSSSRPNSMRSLAEEQTARLTQVLEDKKQRNELINHLLPIKSDITIKMRFCVAVNEYLLVADKADKRAKGRKIVGLFIQPGSLFCVSGVPYAVHLGLVGGKEHLFPEYFADLRALFVDELAVDGNVIAALCKLA